ncbi:hypothetical protein [Halalkalibacterium halodurans]|nr:hypothetical protein [Halalkalibacterium halodurans]
MGAITSSPTSSGEHQHHMGAIESETQTTVIFKDRVFRVISA